MNIIITNKSKLAIENPSKKDDFVKIVLLQVSIANKSKKYVGYLNDILGNNTNKQWFFNIIKKIQKTQDPDIIYKSFLDNIIAISCRYAKKMKKIIDISSFVNIKKKTSNSVLFDEEEVYQIYELSAIIKLYAIISGTNIIDNNLDTINKNSFEYIIQKMNYKKALDKIHYVVYTKLFKCIGLDPTIMRTISLKSTMSDDDFVLYLFDYVLSAILVIYDMMRNPITFIVTSVDQVMVWQFRALYQKSIAYKSSGDLFGKSITSTSLPEKIISEKIYEYIQDFVSKRNKEHNVILTDDFGPIDPHFHNFFVLPLYMKLFNLKKGDEYNGFQRLNIQLFLYYTMKDFMENGGTSMFPYVKDEDCVSDQFNLEEHKLLEILKRVPVRDADKYKTTALSIFENDDFNMDVGARSNKNYIGFLYDNSYKIDCIAELLGSNFSFYGINNIMILNNYLKSIMNIVIGLTFKNLFQFDFTKPNLKTKKYSKQLELEIFPFLMVILNNKMEFFENYSVYISNAYCINN